MGLIGLVRGNKTSLPGPWESQTGCSRAPARATMLIAGKVKQTNTLTEQTKTTANQMTNPQTTEAGEKQFEPAHFRHGNHLGLFGSVQSLDTRWLAVTRTERRT